MEVKNENLHYFVPVDGVIKWIKEMPEEPVPYRVGDEQYYGSRMDEYREALQSAIDNAIEVSNQEEVLKALNIIGNPLLSSRQFYSLECSVQKKISPCGSKYTVALVTFNQASEPTLDDEAERFFNENYSGTKLSNFLKPYIINTFKAARKSEPGDSEKGETIIEDEETYLNEYYWMGRLSDLPQHLADEIALEIVATIKAHARKREVK